jgi:toxin FitB
VIGWLLDTDVISELARPGCDPKVAGWARTENEDRLFISVLTLGEYDMGIANLPEGSPARARIAAAVTGLEARFVGRIVALDNATVRRWGRISGAVQRKTGRAPPVVDTLLAASAIENDLVLVTRNIGEVRDTGADLFDPWNGGPVA